MNEQQFGEFIATQRTVRGWTARHCAELLGVSAQYLNDIERGRRSPGPNTLAVMGDVFGLRHGALYALCGRIPDGCRPTTYDEAVRAMDAYLREV